MATSFPAQSNTYIPELSAKLTINYSRNPKDFAVNELVTITPTDKQVGYYTKLKPEAANRILQDAGRIWHDGQPRPISAHNHQDHEFIQYATQRWNESLPLGRLASEQAAWPLVEAHSGVLAQRAMLFRTTKFYDLMLTSGTYPTGHTATATAAGGGKWDVATTTNRYIQKSLQYAARQIEKATYASVKYQDLTLVISPQVAQAIAASQEIAEGFIQSPVTPEFVMGKSGMLNAAYNLPAYLYGMKLVIDPTIEVTSKIGATLAADYVHTATTAFIVARPGDLVNTGFNATNFSTVHCFVYKGEEMQTEVLDDPVNRRQIVSVSDHFVMKAVAPETAFLFTAVRG